MYAVVARKEIKEIIRDGRFRWLAFTCVILIAVAALSGFQIARQQLLEQSLASKVERDNFLEQGAKNPHAAAHFGQYAFRPVLLPSALDPGASPYMGSMIWLEAHRMNLPEFRPAEDNADFSRTEQLSVAWVLQFIVPLFVIVMTFGTVAGEREGGTLSLAMSQGLSLPQMLLGKGIAALGAILVIVIPLIALCLIGFWLAAPPVDQHGAAPRLAWMAAGYLLYLTSFAGLSLLISTVSRTRRNAFFALTALWLLITIVVPRVATDLAGAVYSTPTPSEFWAGIRRGEGNDAGLDQDPRVRVAEIRAQLSSELLTQYQVDSIDQLPVNFTAVFLQRLEEVDAPIFDYNFDQLWQTYEAQRRLQQLASLLSPALAIRQLSMAMAGTDAYAQRHFSVAAEEYRRAFVSQLNGVQAVEGAGKRFYVAPEQTWDTVPAFVYEPPATAQVLSRHRADLWLLFVWAIAPFALALLLARRARPLV
ncbi:MAG: ABC-2 type transport system permease protein [Halieaceae bacterium]|jgi:ABC-2 type transport system permease protein